MNLKKTKKINFAIIIAEKKLYIKKAVMIELLLNKFSIGIH